MHRVLDATLLEEALHGGDLGGDRGCGRADGDQTEVGGCLWWGWESG
jgi:hypothetical protein